MTGTRQTQGPIEHVTLTATNRSALEVARLVTEGLLDAAPEYQRGSVWTLDQRVGLVRSWCSGVPLPSILVNDRSRRPWRDAHPGEDRATGAYYALVDGRQRVETAALWFDDGFAVPASWFDPASVTETEETDDGPYVRFSGLARPERLAFKLNATIPVVEAALATVEEEAALYLLVNGGGTAQTPEDLERAARVVG